MLKFFLHFSTYVRSIYGNSFHKSESRRQQGCFLIFKCFFLNSFGALTLLLGRREGHLACKNPASSVSESSPLAAFNKVLKATDVASRLLQTMALSRQRAYTPGLQLWALNDVGGRPHLSPRLLHYAFIIDYLPINGLLLINRPRGIEGRFGLVGWRISKKR